MSRSRAHAPTLGEPPLLRTRPPQHHTLRNGLHVLLVERPELPVVDAQLVVRAGAFDDSAAYAGRAYLTADLLDQGTTSRTATQIAAEAELLGASLHTRGSWDFCTIALHVLTPRLRPALELLADVATRPTFPDDEFERKRAERLAAILQEADEPRVVASHAFARGVYGDASPFGLPVGGTRETVTRMSTAALRDFYTRHFAPANAFVLVVGDARADTTLPLLDELLGDWAPLSHGHANVSSVEHPNATGGTQVAADETAHGSAAAPRRADGDRDIHVIDIPGAPQSELRVGCAGPQRVTADYFPLLVANTVLGGAFTSRLNLKLREEKGYTYGAGSSFALRRGGGPFVASTAVATAATADAVADMLAEIGRMSTDAVPADELDRARNYIVLGLPRMFETTADIADHMSEVALYGLGDDYYDSYAARVRAVTTEDVRAAAARWLRPETLTVTVAGDAAAVAGELEAMDIGVVHVHEDT